MKPDFGEKFESKKRGQMSSATTVCTVSQSQLTADTNSADRNSQATRVSRKRAKPDCDSEVKIGVKRKSDLTLGK